MSNIWPPRDFSVKDGTFVEVYTYLRDGKIVRQDKTFGKGVVSIKGTTSRLGGNTPNFVQASRTGNLPVLSLKFTEAKISATIGRKFTSTAPVGLVSVYEKSGLFDSSVSGVGVVFGAISTLRLTNLGNKVKQQVLANMKGQDINLSVDYAERDKTIRMIAHAFSRLAKSRRALMKGDFVKAAQALGLSITKKLRNRSRIWSQTRDLSSGWLELQYGWKPLIMSVYGGVAFLRKSHVDNQYQVFHARSSINDSFQTRSESTHSRITIDTSVSATIKVALKVRLLSPVLADLQSLGITNPAFTAWELTPFSFVVDWALPIGSFLSQLDASMGYKFAGASMTTFIKSSYDAVDYGPSKPPSGYARYEVDLHQHAEKVECFRDSIANFGALLSLPYFKDPNSNLHAANALALLVATHPKY
jgi:hypothetical protein